MGKTTSNAVMAKHHANFLMPTSGCLLLISYVAAYGSFPPYDHRPAVSKPFQQDLIAPLHDECTEGQGTGCTPGCAKQGGVCKVVNGQCSCNIGASFPHVVESSAGATCPGGIIGLPDSQPCPAHYKDNGSRPRVCCPVALQHLVETSAGAACTEGQGTGCTPGCAAMGGVCKVVNGQCSCNIGASGQQIHLNQVRAESDAKDYKYNHCGDASKYDQSKGIKQPECERCNGDGISAFRCSAFTRWKECSDFGPGWDICSMENSAITCPDKPRCGYRIGSTGLKLGPR